MDEEVEGAIGDVAEAGTACSDEVADAPDVDISDEAGPISPNGSVAPDELNGPVEPGDSDEPDGPAEADELDDTAEFAFLGAVADEAQPEEPATDDLAAAVTGDSPAEGDEADDELRMMVLAGVAGVVVAGALIAAVAWLGLHGMLGFSAAPATAQAPSAATEAEVTEGIGAESTFVPTGGGPVNAGANAASAPRAGSSVGSATTSTTQVEQDVPTHEVQDEVGSGVSGESASQSDEAAGSQQIWVPEQGHYEDVYETQQVKVGEQWVEDSAAWDEPVYETVVDEDGNESEVQTGTIHHEATGHEEPIYEDQQVLVGQQWVVDIPGHYE